MVRPIILTVDDDVAVSQAVARDLRARYAERYRIVRATSGDEALSSLEELAKRDLPVALVLADHRMPKMTGIELLERARIVVPRAKLLLLTAYADTDVAIKAINDIGLDHYLFKPWSPPEERLYPVLDDLLDDWDRSNAPFDGVRVIGNQWSERSHETRMFLARNHVNYQWLEVERDPEARRLRALFDVSDDELPLVLLPDGAVLHGATPPDLAAALGLALIENGWRVMFARTTDLVQRLQIARRELALESAIAKLDRYDLLILDDIAYVTKDQAETSVLFELIAARYERRSMLITANQPFGEWGKIFPDQAMTLASIDRLVHHATILEMNVESYRRREALDRKRGRGRPATHATIKKTEKSED